MFIKYGSKVEDKVITQAIAQIKEKSVAKGLDCRNAPITINFQPDRYTIDGTPLLIAISQDGQLKSQFETATSNGGLTACRGGERWRWEHTVFNGIYDEAPEYLRPKYGALNFRFYPYGASSRFGSAFFILKSHVRIRTTFCWPDSYFDPSDFATADNVGGLIVKANNTPPIDPLDDYIEAHIHGPISLANDVQNLVLDPIYCSTSIEAQASRLNIPILWHAGYELDLDTMRLFPDYRGAKFIELAQTLAKNGVINSKLIGQAMTERRYDSQDLKKVWHYLARFSYKTPI